MASEENFTNIDCCENGDCSDDDFTPLTPEDATRIRKYFNDPLLDTTAKYIYECHGDPSGNMIYVGGQTADDKYCIYIKNKDATDSKIIYCTSLMDYVEQLSILDKELLNT